MAVQDYELLLRVRADMLEAIKGMDGLSASIGGAKAATDSVGESADQASERIKKMVAATSQQAQVQESARSQAERAAQTANSTIKSYDDQAAAIRRASDAAAAYRERSALSSGSAAAASALDTERAAMAKLAGQIDPTLSALAKLDAQEKSLNAMRKAGIVGLDDYTRFQAVIDKNRASVTEAGKAMHTFSLNSALARREIGRLGTDIVNGNWGRFDQTALTLANYSGLMSVAFSPLGLAIGAVVGSLGAFAVAAAQVGAENDKLNQSIQQTGNFAGTTVGQLNKMADGLATDKTSAGAARNALDVLVASGKVGSQSLGALGQAAVDMAELTGQSTDKAAAEVLKMFDGTAAGALKANDQYHFLTTSIYEQIKALEDEGDTQRAMEVEAEAFHQAAQARIEQMNESLSGLAKMWDNVKTSAGGAWERMKTGASVLLGSADDQTRLFALLGKKMTAQEGGTNAVGNVISSLGGGGNSVLSTLLQQGLSKVPGTRATFSAADEAELKALQDKIAADTQKASNDATRATINDSAVKADAGLDKLAASIDKAYGKKEKIKELDKYFTDLWAGADPNNAKLNGVQRFVANDGSVSYSGGMYDTLLADINKKFDPKSPKAKSDAAGVAAQAELIKLLGDEQGALNPVTKIWATYNDHVAKANELADKAKTVKGADVTAINAQRDALVKLYGTARDAELEKQANKDREAFEKLRDSIKGVDSLSMSNVTSQIKKLDDWLAKGTITAGEYQKTLSAAIDSAINGKAPPSYKGLDGAVGGPFGELDKVNRAGDAEDKYYKEQMDALDKLNRDTAAKQVAYDAAAETAAKNHQDRLAAIERDRQRATLLGLTASFTAGADAIKQGFGAQSNAYRAAFALSKAAAIAQASVNMYMDISAASAKGWPQNIPLIAQAVGEGLTIIGSIRSISAGFSGGGYTGPGSINQPAGVVHAGEVVWSQKDVARAGGVGTVEAMRLGMRGYAEGGAVPEHLRFANVASNDDMPMPKLPDTSRGGGQGARPTVSLRTVNIVDPSLIHEAMASSEGEQVILNTISRNKSAVKQVIR